jgi:hypothetical protein
MSSSTSRMRAKNQVHTARAYYLNRFFSWIRSDLGNDVLDIIWSQLLNTVF